MNAKTAFRFLLSMLACLSLAAGCSSRATSSTTTTIPYSTTSSLSTSTSTSTFSPTTTTTTTTISVATTSGIPTTTGQYTIVVQNQTYLPATLTVPTGTTVYWINKDADEHSVTSDATPPLFDLPLKGGGGVVSFQFTARGNYPYHCSFHSDMHGSIVVA